MKKIIIGIVSILIVVAIIIALISNFVKRVNPKNEIANKASESKITREMAYEGVNNYCHSEYDWSVAEDNPSIMYVIMGNEIDSEYEVIFRSYTGAFIYFYVDKLNGNIRMLEHVPTLNIEKEAGTINLYDYLKMK